MKTPDTFWTYVNGRLIEIYPEGKDGNYRAVNPKKYDGLIFKRKNEIFAIRPSRKNLC